MTVEPVNQKLRCIAVDDEPFARRLIADDISRVPFLELMTTCASPAEAIDHLKAKTVDLLFLDIQMPVMTGTEFLRTLAQPPLVIITTAFEKYAIEGFELNVVDYLLKPIPFERFLVAAQRAQDQFLLEKGVSASTKDDDGFLFVHSEYKEIKIFFGDILYIEGLKDYVKIFLKSQTRPILTRLNLKGAEAKLPSDRFSRVHNSFIVSLSKITSIQKAQLFIGNIAIPVGEKFAGDFVKKYKAKE
jgi:DNA-binding LytR/AlgR family response regulator